MDTPVTTTATSNQDELHDIETNKDIAAFSYLWVMSVVVYLLRKNSPFVRFHAKQAMVLFALSIIVWFVPFINRVLELGLLACMAYGFLSAAQGRRRDVPIVGPLSRGEMTIRQAWKEFVALLVRLVNVIKDLAKTEHKKPDAPAPAGVPSTEAPVEPKTQTPTPSQPQSESSAPVSPLPPSQS